MSTPSTSRPSGPLRLLILGGTGEARALSEALAGHAGFDATLSLAGRTRNPVAQALPTRTGGFGGIEGLVHYLEAEKVDIVVDATHPFAATMSYNAEQAAHRSGIVLLRLARPPWEKVPGDIWSEATDIPAAIARLGTAPRRVLVALGRNEVKALEAAPQHHYLVRSVDPVDPPLALPHVRYIEARGPFEEAGERAMLKENRIDAILAKNSGGAATYGKIAAARTLGIDVMLVARPPHGNAQTVGSVKEALIWLEAHTGRD